MRTFRFCFLAWGAASAVMLSFASSAWAMEVSFERDPRIPLVYLNVAAKAGAVTDPAGKSGLTSFMAEMLLRGTTARTKEQLDLAIDQIGATLGTETRAEAIVLRGAVLASELDTFLGLVSEVVTQPSFPENEIRKLKSEVISRILAELGNDASLASRQFTRFLFRDHPYGNPISGTVKDVESFSRQDLVDHYNRLIREDLLLVVGTGDTTKTRIDQWAESLTKSRPSERSRERIKVRAPENAESRRLLLVDKPDRTQTQIFIGQIGIRLTDNAYFPLYVGNHAFGGRSFSARLTQEIRVKRGWSYGANSSFRVGLQPRSWNAYLFPAAKDTPEALKVTLSMIDTLRSSGLTQEEYDFARNSLINGAGFMYDTPAKRVENTLLEKTLDLPSGFMNSYAERIASVSLKDVNSSLTEFLKPNQLAVTVLGTAKDLKAPLAAAAAIAEDKVKVKPYTEE